MNDVLKKHNSLMERIVREYGAMIRGASTRRWAGCLARKTSFPRSISRSS